MMSKKRITAIRISAVIVFACALITVVENALKNRINAISLDEKGKIWIASANGIQVFDPASEKYTDVDNVRRRIGNIFEIWKTPI